MIKINTFGIRNEKLENELQAEILAILKKKKYSGLPMLVFSNLHFESEKEIQMQLFEAGCNFIIIGNKFDRIKLPPIFS